MTEKLLLFEYLQELIDKLEKNYHKRCTNYTHLADDIPLGRKDREKLIELLEEFYPPVKKNFADVSRRRNQAGGAAGTIFGIKKFQVV